MLCFIPTIYPRLTDKDYSVLRNPAAWPNQVTVLSLIDFAKETPFISHAFPKTAFEHAELQFDKIDQHLAALSLQWWWTKHEKIITYLISEQEWKGDYALVYNTTWALFGYRSNQCPQALSLWSRIHFNPQFKSTALSLQGTL